ncbi:hypothetical protein BS17DRAFT_782814 [Gyrodon lividus]|nr:hypothetical protein BS17DRAFT_782814 [Gyrodon lividus]
MILVSLSFVYSCILVFVPLYRASFRSNEISVVPHNSNLSHPPARTRELVLFLGTLAYGGLVSCT